MAKYQAPRGTRDLLPADMARWQHFADVARALGTRYGLSPIDTPLFEDSAVFERGIGGTTDVVEKELFRVVAGRADEQRERWALRPEPTAGIVRAYLQHGMQTWLQPVRFWAIGPMFRYDRPQAGRFRQFFQYDVEVIGDPGPAVDAELIELCLRFYAEVGLGQRPTVLVNSIGDAACRPAYLKVLADYYAGHAAGLPETERDRLSRNPLRLLDSKDPRMAALNAAAPTITDHLCAACAEHFAGVRAHLDALGIAHVITPNLVRGLDYYTRTAFEFVPVNATGQQSAIGGGGRYDGMVELLGGKPTPGIGFGIGLDRLALELDQTGVPAPAEEQLTAVVVGADPADTATRLRIATDLRAAGLSARAELGTHKLSRQLEGAARLGAHFAVICGDELAAGQVQLRDLPAGTQRPINVTDLAAELKRAGASHRHG